VKKIVELLSIGLISGMLLWGCSSATSPTKTYKVGDTGPAGGLIFYDKGSVSNGWRYLECGPSDLTSVSWGSSVTTGATDYLGAGKANTSNIVSDYGTSGTYAALECKNYSLNGHNDWYLPAGEELSDALQYLAWNGKGSFVAGGDYWTSTEIDSSHGEYATWTVGNVQLASQVKSAAYRVRPIRQFAP
jgi:hypothetical protein